MLSRAAALLQPYLLQPSNRLFVRSQPTRPNLKHKMRQNPQPTIWEMLPFAEISSPYTDKQSAATIEISWRLRCAAETDV